MVSEILNRAFKLEVRKSNSSRWACKQQSPGSGTEVLVEQEGAGGLVNTEQFPFSGLKCGDLGREGGGGTAALPFWHTQLFPAEAVPVRTCSKWEKMGKWGTFSSIREFVGDENKISSSPFALALVSKEVSCCFLPFP